jgi:hypothetical protein
MHPTTRQLLELTEQPYDNYNAILLEIKGVLAEPGRIAAFERTLGEELPLTTARRAFRTAIQIAMEEEHVYCEWRPAELTRNLIIDKNRKTS